MSAIRCGFNRAQGASPPPIYRKVGRITVFHSKLMPFLSEPSSKSYVLSLRRIVFRASGFLVGRYRTDSIRPLS